jgi:hypothetical protein
MGQRWTVKQLIQLFVCVEASRTKYNPGVIGWKDIALEMFDYRPGASDDSCSRAYTRALKQMKVDDPVLHSQFRSRQDAPGSAPPDASAIQKFLESYGHERPAVAKLAGAASRSAPGAALGVKPQWTHTQIKEVFMWHGLGVRSGYQSSKLHEYICRHMLTRQNLTNHCITHVIRKWGKAYKVEKVSDTDVCYRHGQDLTAEFIKQQGLKLVQTETLLLPLSPTSDTSVVCMDPQVTFETGMTILHAMYPAFSLDEIRGVLNQSDDAGAAAMLLDSQQKHRSL